MVNIKQSYPPPWKAGGKTVTTFPSGILRVNQEYIVPTSEARNFYDMFKSGTELTGLDSPAIDGLFVFPEPQYRDNGNGLTSVLVSAYGRSALTSSDLVLVDTQMSLPFILFDDSTPGEFISLSLSFSVWNLTGTVSTRAGSPISASGLEIDKNLAKPINFRLDGEEAFRFPNVSAREVFSQGRDPLEIDSGDLIAIRTFPTGVTTYEISFDEYTLLMDLSDYGINYISSSQFGAIVEANINTYRSIIPRIYVAQVRDPQ